MSDYKTEQGSSARLLDALYFAAEKHRDHRRKGAIAAPYINHPITVAHQLAAAGMDQNGDLLVAAVLHDVVEDTDTTLEELGRRFGTRVAGIVGEVSDDKKIDWRSRKRRVVETIADKSREARLIKLSDLIANVTDLVQHPPNWTPEHQSGYLKWAEAVVNAIAGVHPALESRFADVFQQARNSIQTAKRA